VAYVLLIEEISMAYIDVDKDIRYYTDRLEEKLEDKQDEINTLTDDIEGLRVTIQELVVVTNKHDVKLLAIATSLDTINQMLKILSKRTGIDNDN